jgi:glutamyl-tRNA synthetase
VLLPKDVAHWRDVVFGDAPALDDDALARVREAGPQFFRAAADAALAPEGGLDAIVSAVKAATGAKGQALWKPLRLALTGTAEGPELAPLLRAMPPSTIHARLGRFA